MNEDLIALCDWLRDTMDPEEIVDFIDIDSAELVDCLVGYLDDWRVDNNWRPEDDE